jgi:hypothetical protein
MFHCNSCNIELKRTSKNNHLKTKVHNTNSKIIKFEQPDAVYAKDVDETLYKTYPITYFCSFCKVSDEKLFYVLNSSCCKKCKYRRCRENHEREYFY